MAYNIVCNEAKETKRCNKNINKDKSNGKSATEIFTKAVYWQTKFEK